MRPLAYRYKHYPRAFRVAVVFPAGLWVPGVKPNANGENVIVIARISARKAKGKPKGRRSKTKRASSGTWSPRRGRPSGHDGPE
jgi:hypothetical protein